MTEPRKDNIYIDVDDEITTIIDKLKASPAKIVALVLPKRAATLQSSVNMKLLKRNADEAKKNIVLITSEEGILPLAGAVGLFVAKTMQSKPAVPPPPDKPDKAEAVVEEDEMPGAAADDEDRPVDRTKSVGELAGALALGSKEETIEVDNDENGDIEIKKPKTKKNKKLKIPNFESFRLRLILGIAAVVILLVGWILTSIVLPKAKITIKTDTSSVNTNLNLNLSTAAKSLDKDKLIVPAVQQDNKKTDSEKIAATGKKDNGAKASGTMHIVNCSSGPVTLAAGTGFSSGGLTFISQGSVTVPQSGFSRNSNGFVCNNDGAKDVGVAAQNGGDKYNLSERDYTIAGSPTDVSAHGSAMAGGTSQIVTVISGQDIENAKAKLKDRSTAAATAELQKGLSDQKLRGIVETLNISSPVITSNPNVDDEAAEVTVTSVVTYSMLGVKTDDLKTLITESAKKQIDSSKQMIIDDGLNKAAIQITDRKSPGEIKISLQSIVSAGPQLNADEIKNQVKGKKKGDTVSALQNRPGIKDVDIDYSPFWVFRTPKRTSRITIVFEQPANNATKDNP